MGMKAPFERHRQRPLAYSWRSHQLDAMARGNYNFVSSSHRAKVKCTAAQCQHCTGLREALYLALVDCGLLRRRILAPLRVRNIEGPDTEGTGRLRTCHFTHRYHPLEAGRGTACSKSPTSKTLAPSAARECMALSHWLFLSPRQRHRWALGVGRM